MEEIPYYVDFFVKKYSTEFKKRILGVSPEVLKMLYDHDWPGNIRELENVIERGVALEEGEILSTSSIQIPGFNDNELNKNFPLNYENAKKIFEKRYLSNLISASGNNLLKASRLAGINPATLHRKVNRYLK